MSFSLGQKRERVRKKNGSRFWLSNGGIWGRLNTSRKCQGSMKSLLPAVQASVPMHCHGMLGVVAGI